MSASNSALTAPPQGRLVLLSLTFATALPVAVFAQAARPPASTSLEEKVVVLDPFVVPSEESGYRASTTQVATGFNRDIEHTPLMINVLTEDFIRDAGLGSYAEVSQFMPNTYVVPQPEGLGSTGNARGQATSYYTQDGVRYYTEPIVRTGSRVEVIKGPATLFFGRAQPGGIFNFGTRPPSATRQQSLVLTYGSYNKRSVDIGSQGGIDAQGKLTYRLDGSLQDNGSFIDHGYDKLKFVRGSVGYNLFDTLRFVAKYEYSDRKQSGNSIAHSVIAPQYYLDYANPRPQQISWAKATYGLGGLTDAAVAELLRGQWKENLFNWIDMTQKAYRSDPSNPDHIYPTYAVGLSGELTPRGWHYNPAQKGTYFQKKVETWGGDAIWTPNKHVSVKASYTKYDLIRPRLNIQLTEILADGNMRAGNMQVREDQNDSTTMSLSALFDYEIGKTHHTTNIGGQYFKDYYRNINGLMYGLNLAPGVAKDPRTSTPTQVAAGYNPQTDPYLDVTQFVQSYPSQVVPPGWAQNYENAVYFSHIAEFFDRRAGILIGGRVQEYEVRSIPFKNTADIDDVNTVGVTWNVTPNLVLFASRSKSFEPNINAFLVNGNGATQAEKDANVHPPVTGVGYDLGIKFGLFDRKLVGQLSAFETNRINDLAFRATDLGRTNSDPRNNDADQNNNVTWSIPGGERLSRGMELEMTFQPNKNYSALITAGWLPVARVEENESIPFVTTLDGRRIRDPNQANYVGQRSANAPKYTFAVWNHYKFPGTRWGAGIGGNYVSEVVIPQQSSYKVTVPSYVNLRAGIDYTQPLSRGELRLSAHVNNLLNEKYFISFYRAEPIALTFRAEYQF